MGASGWVVWTDYQPDISGALQTARMAAFANDGFHLGDWRLNLLQNRSRKDRALEPEFQRQLALWRECHPKPASLEELIESRGPDGTHSIIDIAGVRREGDNTPWYIPMAFGLSHDELIEYFGTDRPTRKQVEARLEDEAFQLEYWPVQAAFFVTTYVDDKPDQIAFVGATGD